MLELLIKIDDQYDLMSTDNPLHREIQSILDEASEQDRDIQDSDEWYYDNGY
jgi:hypothetical protein